jgi:hypothetical protein
MRAQERREDMPMLKRTPLRAALNVAGKVVIEWPADTVFPVAALEAMFILPMPYKALRERAGGRAPVTRRVFGQECLTAAEVVTVVGLLQENLGFSGAEQRSSPLEGPEGAR